MQLVAAVLRDEKATVGVKGHTFCITDSRGVPFGGRERLICFVGVVHPYAAARLKFEAWILAWRSCHAILFLAGIARTRDIDKYLAL